MEKDLGLFILRVGFGLSMFIFHGIPKVFHFSAEAVNFPDPFGIGAEVSVGLAIFSEVICAFLVVAGVATRISTIPLVITCLMWTFIVQSGDPWPQRELAILYLIPFLTILFVGPGRYSPDFGSRKKSYVQIDHRS